MSQQNENLEKEAKQKIAKRMFPLAADYRSEVKGEHTKASGEN